MIEATCAACGNVSHIPEGDVPPGARFVICTVCKARVALSLKTGATPPPIPVGVQKTEIGTGIGIADLPAPRRPSPLAGEPPAKPLQRSALAEADLPAPKAKHPGASGGFDIDLDPAFEPPDDTAADLVAPKSTQVGRPAPELPDLPAPRSARPMPALADLPAPKPRMPAAPAPFDLGAPGAQPSAPELPMPKAAAVDLGAPGRSVADLPMPKGPPVDLGAPGRSGIIDLPTPKGPSNRPVEVPLGPAGVGDLLAPKGFFEDLPRSAGRGGPPLTQEVTPKATQPTTQEVTPKATQPTTQDMAPKGFFEDLPQPAQNQKPEVPAPKGFFEDLPQRAQNRKPELPAPKGFFEDLPQPAQNQKPEVPAPKGFFEDLPGKPQTQTPEVPATKGFFDDLPQPNRTAKPSNKPLDFEAGPELDLSLEASPASSNSQYAELDLARPSASQAAPVQAPTGMRIQTPTRPPPPVGPAASPKLATAGGDLALELEEPRQGHQPSTSSQKLSPKTKAQQASAKTPGRSRAILLGVLLVVALGGGGFLVYQRFFNKKTVSVEGDLAAARAAITASDAAHWDTAAAAARRVLIHQKQNPEALAIAAEGTCGSALAHGVNAPTLLAECGNFITSATSAGAGPRLPHATALLSIARSNGQAASESLAQLLAANPKDAQLQLYLGWAHAAKLDYPAAIKVYDGAATSGTDAIKKLAIYGRAQAKLAQNDLAGARADFDEVYKLDKGHIGAQVGLAAALPISQAQQQESDLMAVLQLKELAQGDQRAVRLAWTLAAEAAKRGNRLDIARERFSKALELNPDDVRALAGIAETEMLDGKLDAAAQQITKALTLDKDDIRSQLVQADLSIKQQNLRDAEARLGELAKRGTLPIADQTRIKLIWGRLFDARGEDEEAVKAYEEAAKLAGETDLVPTLAAVNKLTQLADKAEKIRDTANATALRDRANKLLENLAENADKDPQLALTLGMAYLQANDPAKAEPWLYKVLAARPNDAEAQFQLAKALARLGKPEEALNRLKKAADLAPTRTEIGVEIALTYESAGQDELASKTYSQLLAKTQNPSIELRARAGRFFAKRGEIDKAAEQGEKILESDKNNSVGQYLNGEGLLADGKLDEARIAFSKALETERHPQFLDALGRAAEARFAKDKDSRDENAAIKSFMAAIEGDPKLFTSQYGLGRIYFNRGEMEKAAPHLMAAWAIRQEHDIAFKMGKVARRLQNDKDAIAWFDLANKAKKTAEAYWHLGEIFNDQNNGKGAASALDWAMKLGLEEEQQMKGALLPWLSEAFYLAGQVNKDLNNLPAAKRAWEQYIARPDLKPRDAAKRKNATQHLGSTLLHIP